jgi:hypothetical protein
MKIRLQKIGFFINIQNNMTSIFYKSFHMYDTDSYEENINFINHGVQC